MQGDLAKKKIYPTLYWLFRDSLIPKLTYIFGYARSAFTTDQMAANFKQYCKVCAQLACARARLQVKPDQEDTFAAFMSRNVYIQGQYDKADGYKRLQAAFKEIQVCAHACARTHVRQTRHCEIEPCRIYYLALPPELYVPVTQQICNECMSISPLAYTRLIIEKPFGRDLLSSRALAKHLQGLFKEEQLYRIDHYLGKEMVQNLMVMR
jgi:glucose-6-phosphate 1-dehydrogenase